MKLASWIFQKATITEVPDVDGNGNPIPNSHTGVYKEINGVKVCMNPYGYTGERVETRDRSKVLELNL